MKSAELLLKIKNELSGAVLRDELFAKETTIEITKERLKEVLGYLKTQHGYAVLMDLTGVDYINPVKCTEVVYWLHNPNNYERFRVVVIAERDEVLPSVTELWEGADWFERELFDLFGVKFEGHPDLKRILMPDDWVGHPLRRDYALTEEAVEFKHGVKPKVPSEIIPYVKGN